MDDLFNSSFFQSYIRRMKPPCSLDESLSGNNTYSYHDSLDSNCSGLDLNDVLLSNFTNNFDYKKPTIYIVGLNLFSYLTPFIIIIGLIGNGLSAAVFTSKNMRKMSASSYLAALSAADICTLIFYVFVEWLRRGLIYINPEADFLLKVLNRNGPCQMILFLSYISRLMSTGIIVVFTIERFTGVCYPLKSLKGKCKRILIAMLIAGSLLVLYKPILSGEYIQRGRATCIPNPKYSFESFILDSIFALMITLVPFIVITILNLLIMRTLYLRNYRHSDLFAETTKIRLEFTIILLAISFFFIAFNLPYFAVWFRNFMSSRFLRSDNYIFSHKDMDYWNGVLHVTRTVFYFNYCVNFFLYSITGAYFRNELAHMLRIRKRKNRIYKSHIRSSRIVSSNQSGTIATYTA